MTGNEWERLPLKYLESTLKDNIQSAAINSITTPTEHVTEDSSITPTEAEQSVFSVGIPTYF